MGAHKNHKLRFGLTAAGVKVWYVMAPRSPKTDAETKKKSRERTVRKSAPRLKKKAKLPRVG